MSMRLKRLNQEYAETLVRLLEDGATYDMSVHAAARETGFDAEDLWLDAGRIEGMLEGTFREDEHIADLRTIAKSVAAARRRRGKRVRR